MDGEKVEWFKTINVAGEKLTDQEVRKVVNAGAWTADVKRYFSKTGCAAYGLASRCVPGTPIRSGVWACLAAGDPELAAAYDCEDACYARSVRDGPRPPR